MSTNRFVSGVGEPPSTIRLAAQPMAIELGKIMFADALNSLAPVPN
jgi:hypothetical protein